MELTILKESQHFASADKKYELSALIDVDSFFYGLFDYGQSLHRVGRTDSFSPDLEQLLQGSSAGIRKIKLGLLSSSFTLIPREEYTPDHIESYVKAACPHAIIDNVIFRSDHCSQLNLKVCYPIHKDLITAVTEKYEAASLTHYISTLLEYVPLDQEGVYVLTISSQTIILGIKAGKLEFCTQHSYSSHIDVFYMVEQAFDLLELSEGLDTIYLAGSGEEMTELSHLLKKYHRKVHSLTPSITLDGKKLDDSDFLFPLYTISKCG